jgi:hypothetical protein
MPNLNYYLYTKCTYIIGKLHLLTKLLFSDCISFGTWYLWRSVGQNTHDKRHSTNMEQSAKRCFAKCLRYHNQQSNILGKLSHLHTINIAYLSNHWETWPLRQPLTVPWRRPLCAKCPLTGIRQSTKNYTCRSFPRKKRLSSHINEHWLT